MPRSAGDPRPPDASEIIAKAKGGARVRPGSPSATSSATPIQVFRRYRPAADPAWEQYRDSGGEGTSPADVMGMIDLVGPDVAAGENFLGRFLDQGYEAVAYEDLETGSKETGTASDYFAGPSSAYLEDEGFYAGLGYTYNNDASTPVLAGSSSVDTTPADITQSPTSTTNPNRPRTVAAGYDQKRKTLTVIFRDGTFYNYYSVENNTWQSFKRHRSKGWFIRTYLDAHPRGAADMGTTPQAHQELLYKVARTAQVLRRGALRPGGSGKVSKGVRSKLASFDYGKRTTPRSYSNYARGSGRYR